jgi:hypothetical protein
MKCVKSSTSREGVLGGRGGGTGAALAGAALKVVGLEMGFNPSAAKIFKLLIGALSLGLNF